MPLMPADLSFADAEARLHEKASAQTGLSDFGAEEYREGLAVLLRSYDADADLSPAGRQICAGMIVTETLGVYSQRVLGKKARPLATIALAPEAITEWVNVLLGRDKVHRKLAVVFVKRVIIEREPAKPFYRKEERVVPLAV